MLIGGAMKYFTKEWYELCRCTSLHFNLRAHNGTVKKDEALYRRLYKRKLSVFIQEEKEHYDYNPRGYQEAYQQDFSFDLVKDRFDEYQVMKIQEIHKTVPQELIDQIADLRMLALGYCTSDMKKQLTKVSLDNEKKVRTVFESYKEEYAKQKIPERIMNDINFHDAYVSHVDIIKNEGCEDIIIDFYYGVFTENNRIVFKNAKFITQEQELVDQVFLYKEVYRVPLNQALSGYEFHMLLFREEPCECTIRCSDIIVSKVKK